MKFCLRCWVSGRVQGVFFRAHTRQEAQRLGLNGWARNLADGRVEVLACGEHAAVMALRQWLHQGPRLARVEHLHCETAEAQHCRDGFETY
jgi:acylphosphatase